MVPGSQGFEASISSGTVACLDPSLAEISTKEIYEKLREHAFQTTALTELKTRREFRGWRNLQSGGFLVTRRRDRGSTRLLKDCHTRRSGRALLENADAGNNRLLLVFLNLGWLNHLSRYPDWRCACYV